MLWLGVSFSGLWLYLDFSGFSDVYIGAALIMGYRVPENFARPYSACDISSFWQSWHVTLGYWLRAHIYNPLSRRCMARGQSSEFVAGTVFPIITMLACGAWHGLTAGFLVWGLLHGVALAVHHIWRSWSAERLSLTVRRNPLYRGGAWILTHSFVTVTWVFFLPVERSVSLSDRLAMLARGLGQ
jgi:alginate O-acetyltransferase complex protein AlgI